MQPSVRAPRVVSSEQRPGLGCALVLTGAVLIAAATLVSCTLSRKGQAQGLDRIQTIVVIYAENRAFDNLYGLFPGANGIESALRHPELYTQRDLDGSVLPTLPPVWRDANGHSEADPAFPAALPNRPFRIDAPPISLGLDVPTRDLVHRFYQNKEQIDGGKNDYFAAISDAGGLSMGYYDGSVLPMWKIAQESTLADNFFMGAFGGSLLNHFWLICACTPEYANADAKIRASVGPDGKLERKPDSPASALLGPVQFADGAVTPGGVAVNTVQPPYQPSGVTPLADADLRYADPKNPTVLPPQTTETIGDELSRKGIDWVWYADAWNAALADGTRDPSLPRTVIYTKAKGSPNFQPHHQPFNYFARFDPTRGAAERATHLKDGDDLLRDIDAGSLPPVSFFKPQGSLNQHPGYTDVLSGDEHIATIVDQLRRSPQWKGMVIIVTYDENGGFWDHVAPPPGDEWGPGTRVPTMIISPFSHRGIDHTMYDTTSILKLISERFDLAPLPGIRPGVGDLTNALDL